MTISDVGQVISIRACAVDMDRMLGVTMTRVTWCLDVRRTYRTTSVSNVHRQFDNLVKL